MLKSCRQQAAQLSEETNSFSLINGIRFSVFTEFKGDILPKRHFSSSVWQQVVLHCRISQLSLLSSCYEWNVTPTTLCCNSAAAQMPAAIRNCCFHQRTKFMFFLSQTTVSKYCWCNDTTTMSIINLWPKVIWYRVYILTILWWNTVLVKLVVGCDSTWSEDHTLRSVLSTNQEIHSEHFVVYRTTIRLKCCYLLKTLQTPLHHKMFILSALYLFHDRCVWGWLYQLSAGRPDELVTQHLTIDQT